LPTEDAEPTAINLTGEGLVNGTEWTAGQSESEGHSNFTWMQRRIQSSAG